MKRLKNSLTVRGDSLYCPLPLSLDTYGNCFTDCWHCYFRNLNAVWDESLKPLDLEKLDSKLFYGVRNKNPKTPLAHLLSHKKTIRMGNKADPFQDAETHYGVSREAIKILNNHNWSFVIQTRHTSNMMENEDLIMQAAISTALGPLKPQVTVMPVISPGLNNDWEVLERGRTDPPENRLKHLKKLKNKGVNVGVNGEPFIPGYHTVEDFEEALKLLKSYDIHRYNTYNFHFNAFVAKRLHAIGIDIEAIWKANQDRAWRKTLQKLLDLGKKYDILIGCPDFINSGWDRKEPANTCCGIDVPNPTTFNTHYFKSYAQKGYDWESIIDKTWDGGGDFKTGLEIIRGESSEFYTLKDIK